jgi:DNA-binding SARP family transcriptional activator
VETRVETTSRALDGLNVGTFVRMLGPLTVLRNGGALDLPASRKARAIFGYLALSPHAVRRSHLCDLLWDVADDPRGELRWCLSKLRSVLDETHRTRVQTSGDTVMLDLDDCSVDAIVVAAAAEKGIGTLDLDRLLALSQLFAGDFLDGLEIDRSHSFNSWLTSQRRRLRACRVAILEQIVAKLPRGADQASAHLEKWIELAPFDGRAHAILLATLAERGEISDGEHHLAATARLFESEEMDFEPIRAAWEAARGLGSPRATQLVSLTPVPPTVPDQGETAPHATRRASLAVMPFAENAEGGIRGGLADGLTDDVITRLAKLRSLFVIARGSVFALADRGVGPEDAARRLHVDFVASGSVRRHANRVRVAVELVEAKAARIVWADVFDLKLDDTFEVLDQIGNNIVSSIASEIEMVERNRALLKTPSSLNAWEAYHRGLWHMYRFTKEENELAQRYFQTAVRLDPTFASGHVGLSFTHWQKAFQHWGDRESESDRAFETAGQSLIADDHNPAAHWAMGRALWLRGSGEESLRELERTVDLSPNFALGHYSLSFVRAQSGDPYAAIGSSDLSRRLSPFDPLLFAMLAARALAHARLGQFEEAAEWAVKAATRPNAHNIILATAAHCLALAGRIEEGRAFAAMIRRRVPDYRIDDLLTSYRFNRDDAALFRQVAKRIGLD